MSLDSRVGSDEESPPPPLSSVGRALVLSGVFASNTGAQDVGELIIIAMGILCGHRKRTSSTENGS